MMAIANHFVHIRESLQARRQRSERHEFRALDSAQLVLPGFAHVNENQFFTAVDSRFHVFRCYLQFIHVPAPFHLFSSAAKKKTNRYTDYNQANYKGYGT